MKNEREITTLNSKTMKNDEKWERNNLSCFGWVFVACSVLFLSLVQYFIFILSLVQKFVFLGYFCFRLKIVLFDLLCYYWLFYVLIPPAHRTSALYSPTLQHTDVTTLRTTTGRRGRRGPFQPQYSNQQPNNLSRSRIPCLNYYAGPPPHQSIDFVSNLRVVKRDGRSGLYPGCRACDNDSIGGRPFHQHTRPQFL